MGDSSAERLADAQETPSVLNDAAAHAQLAAAVTLLHILVTEQRVMMDTYSRMREKGERIGSWPRDRFDSNVDYVIEKTQEWFPIP